MKAILISTRPQWGEKILNRIKKDEIRKGSSLYKAINKLIAEQGVAPMLLYCTKDTSKGYLVEEKQYKDYSIKEYELEAKKEIEGVNPQRILNGKVVARFNATAEEINAINLEKFIKDSCLTVKELEDYLWSNILSGTAIHINDLEIFDKPKELRDFKVRRNDCPFPCGICNVRYCRLTRAPQSWCYVEI